MDVMSAFDAGALGPDDFNKAYALVLNYHHKARREGVLSLDGPSQDRTLPLVFRKGLGMVADGTDPSEVLSRLSTLILKASDPGEIALGVLYMQGIYSLQRGESMAVLKMRMAAPLGIEAMAGIIEELEGRAL